MRGDPQHLTITLVGVNQTVPQTNNLGPWYLGVARTLFGRHSTCCLTNNLEEPHKGEVELAVSIEISAGVTVSNR